MEKLSIHSPSNISLLTILLFTSFMSLISSFEQNNIEFIKNSCSATSYPTLCFSSLSSLATSIQTSPKLLAQTALSVTLDTTRSTSASMFRLSQTRGLSRREVGAMRDCMEVLSDSLYELKRSIEEMSRPGSKDMGLVMNDVQTWVSAALTDEDTCSEGFSGDPKMKYVVRAKMVKVAHLTSNALALVNNFASLCSSSTKH